MNIKEVSCQQFAGMQSKSVSMEPGINVVYGPNESGKSTLVNLISGTLFQNTKLKNNNNVDKEFRSRFFPSAKRGKTAVGDFIDGTIVLEADGETYTLRKEWGDDPRCTLSTPEGLIKKQETIDALLSDVLHYGKGVYSEMLLSPQCDAAKFLETFLEDMGKSASNKEILQVLSRAFAESDSISVDEIGSRIEDRIAKIAGKHWDESRNMPERKPSGRWSKETGSIMAAYYALEDAKNQRDALAQKENAALVAQKVFQKADQDYTRAKAEYETFQPVSTCLLLRDSRKKEQTRLQQTQKKLTSDADSWPKAQTDLAKAEKLLEEKQQWELLDQYRQVAAIFLELDSIDQEILENPCPSREEIDSVKKALREINTLENKLCGMNLTADLELLGGNSVQITSLRTGDVLDPVEGKVSLTEAVSIAIPGVMNMVLAPANVNVSETQEAIRERTEKNQTIFCRYGVDSLDALQEYAAHYQETQKKVEDIQRRAELKLAGRTFQELKAEAPDQTRPAEEISKDISCLCGNKTLSFFAELQKSKLEELEQEYGDLPSLEQRRRECASELDQLSSQEDEEIPEAYLTIADPNAHLKTLRTAWEQNQKTREAALIEKNRAEQDWEMALENQEEDPHQQVQEAMARFEEENTLLSHWRHIQQVFVEKKEQLSSNPTEKLAQSFTQYLAQISGGSIVGEMPNGEKLDMAVYSKDRKMDFSKLSEGTKDTVFLAYRLAVLDQLFPEGGGVIVLDDPFTDMDAMRTEQSVELVKFCAQRHQVIFLTCKEELTEALGGHRINMA